MQNEIRSACYRSAPNLLPSRLLPNNIKIKICNSTIFRVVYGGVKRGLSN